MSRASCRSVGVDAQLEPKGKLPERIDLEFHRRRCHFARPASVADRNPLLAPPGPSSNGLLLPQAVHVAANSTGLTTSRATVQGFHGLRAHRLVQS